MLHQPCKRTLLSADALGNPPPGVDRPRAATITSRRRIQDDLHSFVILFGLRTFGRTNDQQIRSVRCIRGPPIFCPTDQREPWASYSDGPSPPTRHSIWRPLLEMNDSKWPAGSPSISQLQLTTESPKPKSQGLSPPSSSSLAILWPFPPPPPLLGFYLRRL